jgi:hypothetical protein
VGECGGIRPAYRKGGQTPFFCHKEGISRFLGRLADSLDKRVRFLEAKLIELSDEQRSSAELIKSLAEQNALMVEAIEVFRVRVKMLLTVCILLLGGLAVVIFRLVV